jgi:hypothetical protein
LFKWRICEDESHNPKSDTAIWAGDNRRADWLPLTSY